MLLTFRRSNLVAHFSYLLIAHERQDNAWDIKIDQLWVIQCYSKPDLHPTANRKMCYVVRFVYFLQQISLLSLNTCFKVKEAARKFWMVVATLSFKVKGAAWNSKREQHVFNWLCFFSPLLHCSVTFHCSIPFSCCVFHPALYRKSSIN